ncbi:MAG: ABC transporter ATP-binding protein [Pirellulaceae bacterium]
MQDPANPFAVRLDAVTKKFGSQTAVDDLYLKIPRGSISGVIGPNGSGKTTTIRLILRIYQPDIGTVEVLGAQGQRIADDRIGYLPEERGLYHRMKVRSVLRFFGRLKGIASPDATIDQWLDRLGAREWDTKRIDQLSKGMAQKIQFIAAVMGDPQLVILDEPFSGLDPVAMEVLKDAVLWLRDQGTTVLLSTHDMEIAERLCDRFVMIYRGRKVLDGTLAEIRQSYGRPEVRVRMASGQEPDCRSLPGVRAVLPHGPMFDVSLDSYDSRAALLAPLAKQGDIEPFESVQPSLHDIFVRIARPAPEDQGE